MNDCPTANELSTTKNSSVCQDLVGDLYLGISYWYVDKITVWSVNNAVSNANSSGYIFAVSWTRTLPGIFK